MMKMMHKNILKSFKILKNMTITFLNKIININILILKNIKNIIILFNLGFYTSSQTKDREYILKKLELYYAINNYDELEKNSLKKVFTMPVNVHSFEFFFNNFEKYLKKNMFITLLQTFALFCLVLLLCNITTISIYSIRIDLDQSFLKYVALLNLTYNGSIVILKIFSKISMLYTLYIDTKSFFYENLKKKWHMLFFLIGYLFHTTLDIFKSILGIILQLIIIDNYSNSMGNPETGVKDFVQKTIGLPENTTITVLLLISLALSGMLWSFFVY